MIEIFKTDIQEQGQAEKVSGVLANLLPNARISFDLDDQDKVLRIENPDIDTDAVVAAVRDLGFKCSVIPDKICPDMSNSAENMKGFWDSSFVEHKAMWGFEPTRSAIIAKDLFIQHGVRDILVPGIGYGRNARVFTESGMKVTGIEISPTAIEMARNYYGSGMKIYNGSVTDMPFDNHLYEGIFCYGLLYLLDADQRKKMILDCYNQLEQGGWMIFSVVSKKSPNYGKGKEVAVDTFEIGKGGQIFFYDVDTVKQDFGRYGLVDFAEIEEPHNVAMNKAPFRFIVIKCRKEYPRAKGRG